MLQRCTVQFLFVRAGTGSATASGDLGVANWLLDPSFRPPPSPPTLHLWGIVGHARGISKARGVVLGDPTGDWDAFPGPGEVVWGVALHASPPPPLPSPHLSTPAGRRDRLDLGPGTPPRAPQVSLVQRGKKFRRPGE